MKTNAFRFALIVATAAMAALFTGCEENSNDPDHNPPAGQGAIVINNNTFKNIDVFIDGTDRGHIDSYENRAYNMTSGVYRVVLSEHDGDRGYSADIDVIEDQNTVLDVKTDNDSSTRYDVAIYYRVP